MNDKQNPMTMVAGTCPPCRVYIQEDGDIQRREIEWVRSLHWDGRGLVYIRQYRLQDGKPFLGLSGECEFVNWHTDSRNLTVEPWKD